jgi:HEPN domain-containing protein
MPNAVDEWVAKAEEDFSAATRLVRSRPILANVVCFHCQQCVEKLLKGLLEKKKIPFTKTHELQHLLNTAATAVPTLMLLLNDAQLLTEYAVAFRYPGKQATSKQARDAVVAAARCRAAVQLAIGKPKKKTTKKKRK